MASAWGTSWGRSWGNSWGAIRALGGHFGFDERHRNSRWKKDVTDEKQRLEKLRAAFYELGSENKEEATEEIFGKNVSAPTLDDWQPYIVDAAMFRKALELLMQLIEREDKELDDEESLMVLMQ